MDDLISRQIAIDGVIKSCFGESNVVIAEAKAINYIKKIPSAKLKPNMHCSYGEREGE